MNPYHKMNQRQLFILSFFILLILIFFQLVGIFRLFLSPLLWSTILALVFYPLYLRLLKFFGGRKNLSSFVVVLLVIIITAGPMTFFSGTLVREVLDFYNKVSLWIMGRKYEAVWVTLMDSPLRIVWDKILEKTAVLNIQVIPLVNRAVQSFSQIIVGTIQNGATNFVFFVINYLATMFVFFFFLRDGASLGQGFKALFPMSQENKEMVFGRLAQTVSAVVQGLAVTGVVQGVLAGLAFWILGVPFPVFFALLIAFMALFPIGGAALVWLPSSIYLALSGSWIKALILFIWGALVISTADNIIKPLVIGGKTNLPTLFLFLAILGGLVFYGFIGIFLGPIMLALFLTLIEIYRKEYPG